MGLVLPERWERVSPRIAVRDAVDRHPYGVAAALAGVGLALSFVIRHHTGEGTLLPLLAAVAVVSYGVGPRLLALGIALVTSALFVLHPFRNTPAGRHDLVHLVLFAVLAIGVTGIGYRLERRRVRLEDAADELEALNSVAARFVSAAEPADVADATLTLGLQGVGAVCGALLVYDAELEELTIERSVGYPPGLLDHLQRIPLHADVPIAVAARGGQPLLLGSLAAVEERFPAMAPIFRAVGPAGAVVPLLSGGELVGGLVLVFADEDPFGDDRTSAIVALGRLCQEALARTRRQAADHRIAETLQRSLLPSRLDEVPGHDVAVRYLPGAADADVGGDWYDGVVLDDGRVVFAVGDVAGRGTLAAAAMGRLRLALTAYAADRRSPAASLASLDAFVRAVPEDSFATAVVLRLDPSSGLVEYASAGHPPPLYVPGNGRAARFLDGGRGGPIDGVTGGGYEDATIVLAPGDALLLYTDGLVERRDRPIARGLVLLARALRRSRSDSAEALVARATRALIGEGAAGDDVALLAVKRL